MDKITRVGIDLGKRVFHVTALNGSDRVVERKRFGRAGLRGIGCEVAMEAWAAPTTGAGMRSAWGTRFA